MVIVPVGVLDTVPVNRPVSPSYIFDGEASNKVDVEAKATTSLVAGVTVALEVIEY